jgi:hypothetical protein
MIKYKVKPHRATENENYIKQVFAQLEQEKPDGVRYAAFKLEDGVTFVHFVSVDDSDRNPLRKLAAFKAFVADIDARCAKQPDASDLVVIGSYRLFGPAETSALEPKVLSLPTKHRRR